MSGFKTFVAQASWPAIKRAAVEAREKYGRWPTHIATPKSGASQELVEHLQGTTLREMGSGIIAQGKTIFLGFVHNEIPIVKMPSWMRLDFSQPEVEEVVVEVAAEPEMVGAPSELEVIVIENEADLTRVFGTATPSDRPEGAAPSNDDTEATEFYERLKGSAAPIVLDSEEAIKAYIKETWA